jgi:Zn-finger protein
MCESKKPFPNREAAAQQHGNDVYQCKFCSKWHRTGSAAMLANGLTRLAKVIKNNRR